MATPIGHLLAGQLAYRAGSAATGIRSVGLAWLCALASVAPDFDFLLGLLVGRPALYHQGVSHSLSAAVAFSLILAVCYRRDDRRLAPVCIPLLLAYLSHLGLDLLGPDRRPPYGIPLLWPWSDATFLSPVALFPGVRHAATTGVTTGEWLSQTLHVGNLLGLAREAVVLGPLVLVVELWTRRRNLSPRVSGPSS